MMYKKIIVAVLAAAGLVSTGAVYADDTGLMVRARAVYLDFNNSMDGTLANNISPSKLEAGSRWIPEVDVSYFFTKNLAAELVLTYPQTVDIKLDGAKYGKIKALPPSLLVQYHFTDLGAFKPYVGAGLNYTLFSSRDNFWGPVAGASVSHSSFGLVGQIGADYALTKNWSLNLDVKYIQMDTKVMAGGNSLGKLDLSPITAGVGVGYRF